MDLLSKKKLSLPEVRIPDFGFAKKAKQAELALEKEKNALKRAINYALLEWNSAINNFEHADSPDLVEYYTYKMKASEVKYQYLLKEVKKLNESL